jgi:hypothetical protein
LRLAPVEEAKSKRGIMATKKAMKRKAPKVAEVGERDSLREWAMPRPRKPPPRMAP